MKKVVMILLGLALILCTACGNQETEEKEIDDFYKQYAEQYEVLEEKEDGTMEIQVTAPDFVEIVGNLLQEYDAEELDVTVMQDAVQNQEVATKKYVFTVEEMKQETVEEAFLDEVSYEMMIAAITEVEIDMEESK